jgi:hypothetical protein
MNVGVIGIYIAISCTSEGVFQRSISDLKAAFATTCKTCGFKANNKKAV